MTETEWSIDTPDGARIYGVTHQAGAAPSKRVVVIVNGLGCFYFNHPYFSATVFFLQQGYDVIGFNLYDAREKSRNILDCTIDTLVADFGLVLRERAATYEKIFLVGHSYGGLTIMTANPDNIAAASLWDPSYNMADQSWAAGITEDLPGNRILIRWGGAYAFGRALWDIDTHYDKSFCRTLSERSQFPVQVIHAGKGILNSYGESWHTHCPHLTDYHLIENAGHNFEQLDSVPVLLDKCATWFGRF